MMRTDKQNFEISAVEIFQEKSGLLRGFSLSPGDDPPDVCATARGEVVGIEVRRLFRDEGKKGSPDKIRDDLRGQIIQLACEEHRKITTKFYQVRVAFSNSHEIDSKRLCQISKMLVNLVVNAKMEQESHHHKELLNDYESPEWPEEVFKLTIDSLPGDDLPIWLNSGGAVGWNSKALIQKALDQKECCLSRFPVEIFNRWLLLVCDGSVESAALLLHKDISKDSYRSRFNRVFVIDCCSVFTEIFPNHG